MDYKYTSRDVDDTLRIAENIESEKFPNMVICLIGELGSGKTVFTKGFASALGIEETITSPTFTLIKEYLTGELPLYHMDLYRLKEKSSDLGFTDYFNNGGVCIIEWADLIMDMLPEEKLIIKIKVINEDTRVLVFEPHGDKYEELCNSVL
ncbi:MAG: tRNA (adenosine(37)-N6)-threonylcarbamoyltransferase complex ATPase subunit type 1 TsaE [Bacilli bacterium]